MIGGFVLGGNTETTKVIVRAIGPSLASAGVSGSLANPTLELHDGNGAMLQSNDDWKQTQQSEVEATGVAPTNDFESAIVADLAPGAYTAVVAHNDNLDSGVALIEVYHLQ